MSKKSSKMSGASHSKPKASQALGNMEHVGTCWNMLEYDFRGEIGLKKTTKSELSISCGTRRRITPKMFSSLGKLCCLCAAYAFVLTCGLHRKISSHPDSTLFPFLRKKITCSQVNSHAQHLLSSGFPKIWRIPNSWFTTKNPIEKG